MTFALGFIAGGALVFMAVVIPFWQARKAVQDDPVETPEDWGAR
jgi:hypothetical protein